MNGQNSYPRIKNSVSEWKVCGGPLHDWSAFRLTVTDHSQWGFHGDHRETDRPEEPVPAPTSTIVRASPKTAIWVCKYVNPGDGNPCIRFRFHHRVVSRWDSSSPNQTTNNRMLTTYPAKDSVF